MVFGEWWTVPGHFSAYRSVLLDSCLHFPCFAQRCDEQTGPQRVGIFLIGNRIVPSQRLLSSPTTSRGLISLLCV